MAVANALNEAGAKAFRSGDYERAEQAIEEAARLAESREKVKGLQKEWSELFAQRVQTGHRAGRRRRNRRLPRGLRTPKEAFRRPILEALSSGTFWIGWNARCVAVLGSDLYF